MPRVNWLIGASGVALLVVGCATIVEGTDQTVTVTTTPAGAVCNLKQNGQTIAIVNPSPGSASVKKSKRDISVVCSKEGYQGGAATLSSSFQAMTFGNIIFGGIVGVAIDAGSGAMHEYQPAVHVTLIPEEFTSLEARDAFFDGEIARIEREAAEAVVVVRKKCRPDQTAACEKTIAAVEKKRDAQLAEMEVRRAHARIAGAVPASEPTLPVAPQPAPADQASAQDTVAPAEAEDPCRHYIKGQDRSFRERIACDR